MCHCKRTQKIWKTLNHEINFIGYLESMSFGMCLWMIVTYYSIHLSHFITICSPYFLCSFAVTHDTFKPLWIRSVWFYSFESDRGCYSNTNESIFVLEPYWFWISENLCTISVTEKTTFWNLLTRRLNMAPRDLVSWSCKLYAHRNEHQNYRGHQWECRLNE